MVALDGEGVGVGRGCIKLLEVWSLSWKGVVSRKSRYRLHRLVEGRESILRDPVVGELPTHAVGVGGQGIVNVDLVTIGVNQTTEVTRPHGWCRHYILREARLALPSPLIGGKPEGLVAAIVEASQIDRAPRRSSKLVPDQLG